VEYWDKLSDLHHMNFNWIFKSLYYQLVSSIIYNKSYFYTHSLLEQTNHYDKDFGLLISNKIILGEIREIPFGVVGLGLPINITPNLFNLCFVRGINFYILKGVN